MHNRSSSSSLPRHAIPPALFRSVVRIGLELDVPLAEKIKAYAIAHRISVNAAIRELLRKALS